MPDVVFDPQFQKNQGGASGYTGGSGPFYGSGSRAIAIYTAGTIPTNLEELVCFNDIPGAIIPDSSLLLHWSSWGGHTISIVAATVPPDLGQVTVTTSPALALQNGTAAEFLYYTTTTSAAAVPARTQILSAAISGSVSLAAGGGDLVIDNLSIVSGSSYSVSQWRHKVYQDFTYV